MMKVPPPADTFEEYVFKCQRVEEINNRLSDIRREELILENERVSLSKEKAQLLTRLDEMHEQNKKARSS
jgi:predicted nuclease with TOPRIM domain